MANPFTMRCSANMPVSDPVSAPEPGAILTHAAIFSDWPAQMRHVLTASGPAPPATGWPHRWRKSPEALALYAACVQAGVIFLPLNTAYTVDELSYFIENSGARMVVCDAASAALARSQRASAPWSRR
jgi:malonyl-CoA/methylmalonyl-CoA synthetase